MPNLTPFLWYDGHLAEAIDHYAAIFPDMKVHARQDMPDGATMSATLEILGQKLILFNGGPRYRFNSAVSLFIECETQDEIDHYYDRLADGGEAMPCGWVADRFGLNWQVVPAILPRLLGDSDRAKADRAMQAMMQMKKFDIAGMKRAHAGH